MHVEVPNHKIYAIKYASRPGRRVENFLLGDPHDGPMGLDYYVWLIVDPAGKPWLVDLGFSSETAAKRGRTLDRDPIDALSLLDYGPEDISDVIVTHLHFDHAGSFGRLPNANFHIQEPEIHFATGRHVRHRQFQPIYEVEDIVSVVRLNYAGQVRFYNGRITLAPGIEVIPAPGHSSGLQIVRVHTERGWVVIASDASHFYEHIATDRAFPAVENVPALMDSYEMILRMVDNLDYVIPGHDPIVMDIFPAASSELQGKVARVDLAPETSVAEKLGIG